MVVPQFVSKFVCVHSLRTGFPSTLLNEIPKRKETHQYRYTPRLRAGGIIP